MPTSITPQQAKLELYRRSPKMFRADLKVDGPQNSTMCLSDLMEPCQLSDFDAIDPCLLWITQCPVKTKGKWGTASMPVMRRFFYQRSRGRSKTTDQAANLLFACAFARKQLEIVVLAEDREQGKLVKNQAQKIIQHNQWLYDFVDLQRGVIRNKHNDTVITFLSQDTYSSFGITPDYVLCDEFTHWSQEIMWESILSSYLKKEGILVIACNAGEGHDWKFRVKQEAMASHGAKWYHSAPEGPAPWLSVDGLAEQQRLLSPQTYERLWLNIWQASDGQFVTLTEADACVNANLIKLAEAPYDALRYVAALDYAEKHDRTVGVVAHQDGDVVVVDRMDVIDPRLMPDKVCRVDWCEQWIRKVHEQFAKERGDVYFVVDKYQLLYVMQKMKDEGFFIDEFDFKSGVGNWELSYILRHLVVHRKVQWYAGCGEIYHPITGAVHQPSGVREDLSTELASLITKSIGQKWRFNHRSGEHDDRAFALGAAARFIVMYGEGTDTWSITPPNVNGWAS